VHRPAPRADGRPTECAVFGWRQSFGVVRAGADDARGVDAVWLVRERGGERGGGVVRAPSDSDRRASSAVDASVSTSIRRPQLSLCGCPRASFARFAAGVAALCTIFERCLCRRRRLRARGSAVCGGRPPRRRTAVSAVDRIVGVRRCRHRLSAHRRGAAAVLVVLRFFPFARAVGLSAAACCWCERVGSARLGSAIAALAAVPFFDNLRLPGGGARRRR
jgi:hypothetical protein